MTRKNLVGQKYGHLTVIEMLYDYKTENTKKRTYCRCKCDCGNEIIVQKDHLQRSTTISCGCMTNYYRTIHNRSNEIGNTYGYLTIIDIDYSDKKAIAKCQCKCGNIIYVNKADVVAGHTLSCGCLQKERAIIANTKDFSGFVADTGVVIHSKHHQNEHGTWYYNCICPLCGNFFVGLPAKIIQGHTTSCGCKVSSSKERIISSFLDNEKIKYERQKRFVDCKYKYTLPFDFALYDNNDKLKCLIEYDGEQHFKPVEYFGGEEGYHQTIIRDNIKNDYCAKHNIPLLRLNYQDTNIDIKNKILNTFYP